MEGPLFQYKSSVSHGLEDFHLALDTSGSFRSFQAGDWIHFIELGMYLLQKEGTNFEKNKDSKKREQLTTIT